ncbi:MAG: hypothetical protein ACK5YS_05770 [bacterium]|jgi:hypothetical protein
MRTKIFTLLIIFLNGCSSELPNELNDFVITPTYSTKDGVEYIGLTSEFKFNRDTNFIFDHDALSLDSYYAEDENILNAQNDLFVIMDSIKHPQFVIENRKGVMRFFSEITFFEDEKFNSKDVFKLERTLDTLKIRRNESAIVKSIFIDVNRLKINQSDSTIRLYYIYKPSEEERALGFNPIVLKSNWVSLYR